MQDSQVAQSVKGESLDTVSGHDLTVMRSSPEWGSALTVWSLLGILSLPLSLCPSPACTHTVHAFSLSK